MILTLGASFLMLSSPASQALGFGRTSTTTTLGQPLEFNAAMALDASESLTPNCVFANVFAGDAKVPSRNVRIHLDTARDGGSRSVRVTTTTIIDEPVVTVEIKVGCTSSVSRRFVAFIDPPLVNLAEARRDVATQEATPPYSPILEASRAAATPKRRLGPDRQSLGAASASPNGARRTIARAVRPSRQATASVSTRASGSPRVAGPRSARPDGSSAGNVASPATGRGTARLQLEAAPSRVATATVSSPPPTPTPTPASLSSDTAGAVALAAPGATVAARPASASEAEPTTTVAEADTAAELLAHERARIQTLEAGMTRLANDAQAMQKSVATLQARLREAESDRYSNKLVYSLAAGLLFFALLAAALWAVRPRQRLRARWFDAAANQQARALRNPSSSAMPPAPAPRDSSAMPLGGTQSWTNGPPGLLPVTAPATIGGLDVTTVLGPELYRPLAAVALASAEPAAIAPVVARASSMSMEELIDLEQQAEFFVVLGQDEAAIDLLDAHIRDAGSASPLPYLKLLEIHQRRRDQASYERVRESFKERFKAFAPEWSADLQYGRSLDDYPQTIARLQALWPTPMHAMQTLDGLLFRRSEADEAFDFPAYRELLFLYSIARELTGHVETDFGSIDLFLPLDDAGSQPSTFVSGHDIHSVDLDVSSWDEAGADEFVIRRAPGRLGKS
ncbi:MAG: hypothetical protein ABI281_08125 [Caldimonas sp.]